MTIKESLKRIDEMQLPEDLKGVVKSIFLLPKDDVKTIIVLTTCGGDKANKGIAETIERSGVFSETTVVICSGNYLIFLLDKETPFPGKLVSELALLWTALGAKTAILAL